MKLPANVRYAVRVLIELHGATEPVPTAFLAEKLGLSLRVMENIHAVLRSRGITTGTVGARGGIQLVVPLEDISLGRLLAFFDNPVHFTVCSGEKANDCPAQDACAGRGVWHELSVKIQSELDAVSLSDILHRYPDLPLGTCAARKARREETPSPQRPMRRKDRALSEAETNALLERGVYGTLSMVENGEAAYAVPLSYVWRQRRIYFHCAQEGRKIDALRACPAVCFTVVGDVQAVYKKDFTTLFESATLSGTAYEVVDDEEKRYALTALAEKYLPQHMDKAQSSIELSFKRTAVYAIEPDWLSGKAKR